MRAHSTHKSRALRAFGVEGVSDKGLESRGHSINPNAAVGIVSCRQQRGSSEMDSMKRP